MYTYANKTQENKTRSVANRVANNNSRTTSTAQFVDNRPLAIQMRKIQERENNSRQGKQPAQLIADNYSSQQLPMQRKENKTGLPDNLKSGIENLSGYSMDDVKVHYNSDKPSQLQAHAYTQGTNVHVAPGQEKHLPHEAWHVVQQMQGRVKPTMQAKGVAINDDRALEREADLMGGKAASFVFSTKSQYMRFPSSEHRIRGTNASETVQRYLIVDDYDYTRWYREMAEHTGTDFDTEIRNTLSGIFNKMIESLDNNKPYEAEIITAIKADTDGKLSRQITKWIEDKPGDRSSPKSHPNFGRKNQPRVYTDFKDLSFALYGWIKAKGERHKEKIAAKRVQDNEAIGYHLDSVFLMIKSWIYGHKNKKEILKNLKNPDNVVADRHWNIYQNYFQKLEEDNHPKPPPKLPASFTDVLKNPAHYNVRDKTGILHDIMHYFLEKQRENKAINLLPEEPYMHATEIDTINGGTERVAYNRPDSSQIRDNLKDADGLVKPEHMPGEPKSVVVSTEESHGSYIYARSKGLPMYGRHSYTAARMMLMAEKAGATVDEKSAIAWSIMSFWRNNYDHTSIPYHTLHEILDFAPDLGIAYDPENRFAGEDTFTNAGFINSLKKKILANPNDRDVNKLIEKDAANNIAAFFLGHQALWVNGAVMNFWKTPNLPEEQFLQLDPVKLHAFFSYNKSTKGLLRFISETCREHVLSGCSPIVSPKQKTSRFYELIGGCFH